MRYRLSTSTLIMTITSVYVLYLGLNNQLELYIHPRYIVFTYILATIGLILSLLHSHYQTKTAHQHHSSYANYPLIALLIVAIVLPAQSLTSATVSQRTIDSGSITAAADTASLDELFAGSSLGLKVADWSRLLSNNQDPAFYLNKPAKISGFAYDAGYGADTVLLARFILTCCAVDAQPVGVPVQITNWQDTYQQDEWIEVTGSFSLEQTNQGQQIVLVPDSVQAIEEPSNPYGN